ncbi:MAG: hypothetical protein ABEI52_09485, partial [Halobacteriaceae archaeon]
KFLRILIMSSRRAILKGSVATIAGAFAGCAGLVSGSGGTDSPAIGTSPYPVTWLPSVPDESVVSARFADVAGLGELNKWTNSDVPLYLSPNQPVKDLPLGIYWSLDFSTPAATAGPNFGTVIRGDVNPDAAATALPDDYSERGASEGFTIYEGDFRRVAIAEEYLITGPKPKPSSGDPSPIEQLIDTRSGEQARALTDSLSRALKDAGDGLVVTAKVSSNGFDSDAVGHVQATASAVDAHGSGTMTGRWSAVFEDASSAPSESAVSAWQEQLAAASAFPRDSFAHQIDNDRVTITASERVATYWQRVSSRD